MGSIRVNVKTRVVVIDNEKSNDTPRVLPQSIFFRSNCSVYDVYKNEYFGGPAQCVHHLRTFYSKPFNVRPTVSEVKFTIELACSHKCICINNVTYCSFGMILMQRCGIEVPSKIQSIPVHCSTMNLKTISNKAKDWWGLASRKCFIFCGSQDVRTIKIVQIPFFQCLIL